MSDYSVFDILGPVMIGPSSSHTAGAARIGKLAATIYANPIEKVSFYLHGSFAQTYRGHGTDKALVAGILGMETYDENLRDAMSIATKKGITYEFIPADLGSVHENTVKIVFSSKNQDPFYVTASSIGGGSIEIIDINGCLSSLSGANPAILVQQYDKSGVISHITAILAENNINIAIMKVSRNKKGGLACTIIETDDAIPQNIAHKLENIENIIKVTVFNPKK